MPTAEAFSWLDMGREEGLQQTQARGDQGEDAEEKEERPGLASSGGLSGQARC